MTKINTASDASQTFDSVWDAICDTPEEAANMKLRTEVMMSLEQFVKDRKPVPYPPLTLPTIHSA